MISTFESVTSTISIFAGVLSVLATIISFYVTVRRQTRKLREAEKHKIVAVLAHDNIDVLGSYVDEIIGAFDIYEYSFNTKVREQVDDYIERIQNYVGTTEEIEEEIQEEPQISRDSKTERSALSEEFRTILQELRTGEPWNALARLRRHIEITLRDLANQSDLSAEKATSAGRLLSLLERNEIIPPQIAQQLRYPISICNKAIHGYEVELAEAEDAIFHAGNAIQELIKN